MKSVGWKDQWSCIWPRLST